MKIKYVGLKQFEDAFEAETAVTWGPDVEHDIADPDLCARMLKHPDVFAVAGSTVKEPASKAKVDAVTVTPVDEPIPVEPDHEQVATPEGDKGAKHVMQTEKGPLVLDALDKDTLKALAKELDVAVGNSGEDKIRQKLVEAFPVKA